MVELKGIYKRNVERMFKKFGLDVNDYDIESLWDNTLTWQENKRKIIEFLKNLTRQTDTYDRDYIEHLEQEQRERYEQQLREDLKREIESIKQSPQEIKGFYKDLILDIEFLLKNNYKHGLYVYGDTGLGKTHMIIETLKKNGLKFNDDFYVLSGHITPLEFVNKLWDYKNAQAIIIEDISEIMKNDKMKNILIQALFNPSGKRIVDYNTTSKLLKAYTPFVITSKLIFTSNNPIEIEALKDRCIIHEVFFTYSERIKLIYCIAKYNNIPLKICNFIKTYSNEATHINLRTLFTIYEWYRLYPRNWEKIALKRLDFDRDLYLINELLKENESTNEQIKSFIEETGKSKATFYRLREKLLRLKGMYQRYERFVRH